MIKHHKQVLLFCLLIFMSAYSFAARYDIQQLPDNFTITAINNVGMIIGLDNNSFPAIPFAWPSNEDNNQYEITDIMYLSFVGIDPAIGADQEVHTTDINNQIKLGSGGDIVGWYLDENKLRQGIVWYQQVSERGILSYRPVVLPPITEKSITCSDDQETDFAIPECINKLDAPIVNGLRQCAAENANWENTDEVFLPPCNQVKKNICEYRIKRTKSKIQPEESENLNGIENIAYDFETNPDYTLLNCVIREHVRIAILASQCEENDNWKINGDNENDEDKKTLPPPFILLCDIESLALNVNNQGTIVGISYDAIEAEPHPLVWNKSASRTETNDPIYATGNLGIERIDDTPTNIKSLNDNQGEFDPLYSSSFKTNYRSGRAILISKSSNSVTGYIFEDEFDSTDKPIFWQDVKPSGYSPPLKILSTEKNENDEFKPYNIPINLVAIRADSVVGWFEEENTGVKTSVEWLIVPQKDDDDIVTEFLTPTSIRMLERRFPENPAEKGQVLASSASTEIVGTAVVTNNNNIEEQRAFFQGRRCGTQDLNQLTVSPDEENLLLTRAYQIANNFAPNKIIVEGKNPSTPDIHNYVLTPVEIEVDLRVSLRADHDTLTVGDEHEYFITISNVSVNNFATCIFFNIKAEVYQGEVAPGEIPPDELLGGLSFLSVTSADGIECEFTLTEVVCGMQRLNAQEPRTIRITTKPRALLADRTIRTSVKVVSTEKEITPDDNTVSLLTKVERKGCFIATAAYGSYLTNEVKALRLFRDNVLVKTTAGNWLVERYYDYSPPMANYISQHESLRNITRWLLTPMVYGVLYPVYSIVILICIMLTGLALRRRQQRIK